MNNLFEHEWEKWAGLCLHPDITPQSEGSLEIAFYCGAMSWCRLVHRIASEHDPIDAVVLLTELTTEMTDFARSRTASGNGPKEYRQ